MSDAKTQADAQSEQLKRIRRLRSALFEKAINGDVRAAGMILKFDEQESKLLGSDGEKRKTEYFFRWQNQAPLGADVGETTVWRTPGDCADVLGVSPKTVIRAVKRGELSAGRTPGGHYRISGEELERYRAVFFEKDRGKPDKRDGDPMEQEGLTW